MADAPAITLLVCTPCRLSKRKCDGCVPCSRCVARGEVHDCIKPTPKKRGRPPKRGRGADDARIGSAAAAAAVADADNEDMFVRRVAPRINKRRATASAAALPALLAVAPAPAESASSLARKTRDEEDAAAALALFEWTASMADDTASHSGGCQHDSHVVDVVDSVTEGGCDCALSPDNSEVIREMALPGPDAPPITAALLSALAQIRNPTLTIERPRDLSMAMGTRLRPNFFLLQAAKLFTPSGAYDLVGSIMASRVVAAAGAFPHEPIAVAPLIRVAADGTVPQWSADPHASYVVGRTMRDLMAAPPQPARMRLYHRVATLPTGGVPVVRSVTLAKSTPQFNEVGRAITLRIRSTICISADALLEWMYVAVEDAHYTQLPEPLEPPLPNELEDVLCSLGSPTPPLQMTALTSQPLTTAPPLWRQSSVFDLGPWH